jgi:DNA-directed RNA polymerase subunit beta
MQISFTEKKILEKVLVNLKKVYQYQILIEVQKNSYKELTDFNSEANEI